MKNVHERRVPRRLWLAAAAATVASIALPAVPANAAPEDTRVLAYRLPCGSSVCDDDSDRLNSDDVTDGGVQLQAKTSSAIGLSTVELQLQLDGDWRCVHRWATSARSGTWHRNVDLGGRVEGCSGETLTDGSNGVHRVRTLATDRSGSQWSSALTLRVSSPPAAPTWAAAPERAEEDGGTPTVVLRWYANPEPDVEEYHFIRDDGNRIVEYAVSADRPGGQGCSLSGGVYTCTDDDFPDDGYSGNYRYALAAFRSSPDPSGSCSLPGAGSCVRSPNSATHTLALRQPPAPPPDPNVDRDPIAGRGNDGRDGSAGSGSGTPGRVRPRGPTLSQLAGGDYDFESGKYDLELPYQVDPTSDFPLPAPGAELGEFPESPTAAFGLDAGDPQRQRQGLIALAGGFLLLIVAVHLARVLRAPAQTP